MAMSDRICYIHLAVLRATSSITQETATLLHTNFMRLQWHNLSWQVLTKKTILIKNKTAHISYMSLRGDAGKKTIFFKSQFCVLYSSKSSPQILKNQSWELTRRFRKIQLKHSWWLAKVWNYPIFTHAALRSAPSPALEIPRGCRPNPLFPEPTSAARHLRWKKKKKSFPHCILAWQVGFWSHVVRSEPYH